MNHKQIRKRTMTAVTFYIHPAMISQIDQAILTSSSCADMNKSDFLRTALARQLAVFEAIDAQKVSV